MIDSVRRAVTLGRNHLRAHAREVAFGWLAVGAVLWTVSLAGEDRRLAALLGTIALVHGAHGILRARRATWEKLFLVVLTLSGVALAGMWIIGREAPDERPQDYPPAPWATPRHD